MNFYREKHSPMIAGLLCDPDTPAPYLVCGHLYFESMSDLQSL